MKDHFIKNFKSKKGHEIVIKKIDYVLLFEFNEFLKNFVSKSEDFFQIKEIILNKVENTNIINIMRLIEDNNCILICGIHNDKIIGFSGLITDDCRNKGIFEIFIHKNYRNAGIGKVLTQAIIKYSQNIELKQINLSVRKNNIPAIRLYEKMGFIKQSRDENSIVYRKKLITELVMIKQI